MFSLTLTSVRHVVSVILLLSKVLVKILSIFSNV